MYLGDNLLNRGIVGFVEQFVKEKPAAQILLTPVPDPQMFGVAELEQDKVVRLVEKPKAPKSNLALVGVYMFGPEIFTSARRIRPSFRNELEITDAIQGMVDAVGEDKSELFLVKLALLAAQALGDETVFADLLARARQDL